MILWHRTVRAAAFLTCIFVAPAVLAQDGGSGLQIELLKLSPGAGSQASPSAESAPAAENADASCDMLWSIYNPSETVLSSAVYTIGIFTTETIIYKNVLFRDLPASRSRLVQFAMEHECDTYEEILFSDLRACKGQSDQDIDGLCDIENLTLSSPRTKIRFRK